MNYNKVLTYIVYKDNKKSKYWHKLIRNKDRYPNILNYVNNMYDDSESIDESLCRIVKNIDVRPGCVICHGHITYESRDMQFRKYCSAKCRQQDIKFKRKLKEINKERHGDPNFNNREKSKVTCMSKYGVDNPQKNVAIRKKTMLTNYDRYNGPSPIYSMSVKHKIEQTCMERYGSKSWHSSPIGKEKMSSYEIQSKINNSKRDNDTFNSSGPEILIEERLKSVFNIVKTQHRDELLYPFNCDFYIEDIDTWIEYNGFWTHGHHPFDENNEDDINMLNIWKSKGTKYYNNAIDTWTKRDVKKYNMAKQNHLNYFVFYTPNDFDKWIEEYEKK